MLRVVADQQKDNLCGSFCVARIINADQDLVAIRAGATLPLRSETASVPPGAHSYTDYRYELPLVADAEAGTSPGGLMKAIQSLSEGALIGVPVHGDWSDERVKGLVDRAQTLLGARLIANLRTGCLWGSRPSAGDVLAELSGREVNGPPADWDVGHFVELAALVRGSGGSLVVVHDTYPTLGWGGYHLQPPRVIAGSLHRGDGREGGVLVVVKAGHAGAVEPLLRELGLEVGAWDNGCGG